MLNTKESDVQRGYPTGGTTIIYTPRSGSRVFALELRPWIRVARLGNQSWSVIHDGVELSWTEIGRPWRPRARALLDAYVAAGGGIAWDEQGALHAIVERGLALDIAAATCELVRTTNPRDTTGLVGAMRASLDAQLLAQHAAEGRVGIDGRHWWLEATGEPTRGSSQPVPDWQFPTHATTAMTEEIVDGFVPECWRDSMAAAEVAAKENQPQPQRGWSAYEVDANGNKYVLTVGWTDLEALNEYLGAELAKGNIHPDAKIEVHEVEKTEEGWALLGTTPTTFQDNAAN